jgi:hypothetical protein
MGIGKSMCTASVVHTSASVFLGKYTMKRSKLLLAGLVVLLILGFVYLISGPDGSLQAKVDRDIKRDVARFKPQNSLDISMAMGLVTYDPPTMLNPPTPGPPLLLYPPSQETLANMCGV